MNHLKTISQFALWIYAIFVPLTLFAPPNVKMKSITFSSENDHEVVSGELVYQRGGTVSFFGYSGSFLSSQVDFEARSKLPSSYSEDSIARGIESGEIQSSDPEWKPNWLAFLMGYVVLWLGVAFLIGISGGYRRS